MRYEAEHKGDRIEWWRQNTPKNSSFLGLGDFYYSEIEDSRIFHRVFVGEKIIYSNQPDMIVLTIIDVPLSKLEIKELQSLVDKSDYTNLFTRTVQLGLYRGCCANYSIIEAIKKYLCKKQ